MRAFLSFHIPEKIAERILAPLETIGGFSPYPPDTLHATLQFIGEIDDTKLDGIQKGIDHITSKYASNITLEFKNFFLEDNRLRAAIIPTVTLLQLQGEISVFLHSLIPELKSHIYVPHVTLGVVDQSVTEELIGEYKEEWRFEADTFHLFETIPHEGTGPHYESRHEFILRGSYVPPEEFHTIALPTRPQPDTICAISILKRFGDAYFPGIEKNTSYISFAHLPEGENEESLLMQGVIPLDVGGGVFDHHNREPQTTASRLVAEYLGVNDNPALTKLLEYAERDDFYGKGTISTDPLDRAFGLSGLISSLNKQYTHEGGKVIEIILPLLGAYITEEERRAFEMPKELEEKLAQGKAQTFVVKQRGKKLKCIIIETDNVSMAGYLRSKGGGGYDVVVLRLSSGHTNILTRPTQRIDLRSLAVIVRIQESEARGNTLEGEPQTLAVSGTMKEVPEWYYDTATNSLLNGGPNPQNIEPTHIDSFELPKIIELGLSEALWSPLQR